jgi:murein endopeptidase
MGMGADPRVTSRHGIAAAVCLALAVAAAALTVQVVSPHASAPALGVPVSVEVTPPAALSPAPALHPLRVPRHRSAAITIPHRSRAIGAPNTGRLEGGVVLPASGPDFFTWDGPSASQPNPDWRRVGTDTLVTWLQGVLRYFRATHPGAPRIGIGDLSLPHGGPFGPQYGGLGHASHQNGLDVDVLYPRLDHTERPAQRPELVDRQLSQALVDTFVAAGARFAFVGQHVGLGGPPEIVQAIANHDDHVHVRINPLR